MTQKALIDADTVSGSPSQEEAIATAQGFAVTVVSDATWGAMKASDFGQYDLLIAGDPTCGILPPGLISSASVYGPVVLGLAGGRTSAGNRIVVGTDPVFHDGGDYTSPDARGTIIREGIAYAGSQPGTTGMYFDSTCGANSGDPAQSTATLSILEALSAGSGAWTVNASPPCGGSVSLIASNPSFADLTTASLQGWSCSVHESFPTFRTDWSALAVATDTPSHPTCGVDPGTGLNACGEAYILIAGSSIVVNSKVISVSPLDSTNPVGTSHTVTANVHAVGGTPVVVGQLVDFTVTGQNAGASGTCAPVDCKSDVNGNVSFTYFDGGGAGDDTIKASFTDTDGSLQTATAQKHWVSGSADVSITKTDSPDPATVGNALTYTLTVQNGGPDSAAAVTVTDVLPAGVTFASADAGCSNASGTVTCSLGTLDSGQIVVKHVVVTPTTANPSLSNTATVSSSTGDPESANNSSTTTTQVNGTTGAAKPDGQIKRDSDTSYLGEGIYNATGAHQTRTVSAARTQTRTFYVKIENDATTTGSIGVIGAGNRTGFSVHYYDSGGTDITTAIVNGTYSTGSLAPEAAEVIHLVIHVTRTATVGLVRRWLVTATSLAGPASADSVKAKVIVSS